MEADSNIFEIKGSKLISKILPSIVMLIIGLCISGLAYGFTELKCLRDEQAKQNHLIDINARKTADHEAEFNKNDIQLKAIETKLGDVSNNQIKMMITLEYIKKEVRP